MSKTICQYCGAKQPTNRRTGTCVSCGKELYPTLPESELPPKIEDISDFVPSRMTKIMTGVSIALASAELVTFIVLLSLRHGHLQFFLFPLLLAIAAATQCLFPLQGYYIQHRRRKWIDEALDLNKHHPNQSDLESVFAFTSVYLIVSLILVIVYFVSF